MNLRNRICRGFSLTGCVLALLCVSLAGVFWLKSESIVADVQARQASVIAIVADTNVAKPIEQIHVGQRVVTPQAAAGIVLPTEVDPASWKQVSLRMVSSHAGIVTDTMLVETLQPPRWLTEHQVKVGARVSIPLDLREMGVPEQPAEVTAVSACPPIETGPGRVVLTTVNHLNNFLFDLSVRGERTPSSLITVTGWHKLYSEDRAAWVSVCELKTGEKMRGRNGSLSVASLVRHPGVETVYNMTVEREHQYYVADARLLAHNASCFPSDAQPGDVITDVDPSTLNGGRRSIVQGKLDYYNNGGTSESPITVQPDGTIVDGNTRAYQAGQNGQSVTVKVIPNIGATSHGPVTDLPVTPR